MHRQQPFKPLQRLLVAPLVKGLPTHALHGPFVLCVQLQRLGVVLCPQIVLHVPVFRSHRLQQPLGSLPHVVAPQLSHHPHLAALHGRLAQQLCRQQQAAAHLVGCRVKRVVQLPAVREQLEESVQVHQVQPALLRGRRFGTRQFVSRHLAPQHHVAHLLRQLVHHLVQRYHKRVFVAVAERVVAKHLVQHLSVFLLAQILADVRVAHVERHYPVADVIEERVALHLRESLEEYVHALLLHVHHAAHRGLHLLHAFLLQFRVQHLFQPFLVALLLGHFLAHHSRRVCYQVWHDFLAYGAAAAGFLHAVRQLYLQFLQLLARLFRP